MSYVLIRRRLLALLLAAAVFANVPAYAAGPRLPLRSYDSKGVSRKVAERVIGGIVIIALGFSAFFVYKAVTGDTNSASDIVEVIEVIVPTSDRAIERSLGDKHAKAAQAKHHIDEYIHYLDQEGNAGIGKVVRTFQDVTGETFLLEDGNEVDADQLMGGSRGYFGWGKITSGDTVFFSTEHAEALDAEAHAFVADERHGIIKAKADKFFSSYYIKAIHDLDKYGLSWDEGRAEFLIHRDKIVHYIEH